MMSVSFAGQLKITVIRFIDRFLNEYTEIYWQNIIIVPKSLACMILIFISYFFVCMSRDKRSDSIMP